MWVSEKRKVLSHTGLSSSVTVRPGCTGRAAEFCPAALEAEFRPWSGRVLQVPLSRWICRQELGYFAGESNAVDVISSRLVCPQKLV